MELHPARAFVSFLEGVGRQATDEGGCVQLLNLAVTPYEDVALAGEEQHVVEHCPEVQRMEEPWDIDERRNRCGQLSSLRPRAVLLD